MALVNTALTLKDLPPPPEGKTGWPWTEQTEPWTDKMADGSDWPRISIVTPSYNQGQFIEETILSVLWQGYPNLEYIIIDGGSTDNSVEIIKKYENYLTYWVSEPDQGQTDAINKGLKKSTGEIWSYLNSDDLLYPGALYRVAEKFQDPKILWVGGISKIFDENKILGLITPTIPKNEIEYLTPWRLNNSYIFPCSNVSFMSQEILKKCGFFDETYDYSMDIEYYVRTIFQANVSLNIIPEILGGWRWHSESKTMKMGIAYGFRGDEIKIANQYKEYLGINEQDKLEQELRIQNKWLILRKSMFYKQQFNKKQAFIKLFEGIKIYPSLLWFRPWLSAVFRLIVGL